MKKERAEMKKRRRRGRLREDIKKEDRKKRGSNRWMRKRGK